MKKKKRKKYEFIQLKGKSMEGGKKGNTKGNRTKAPIR